MLCDLCRTFTLSVLRDDLSAPWQPYRDAFHDHLQYPHGCYQSITASAEAGCQFCRFFSLCYSWRYGAWSERWMKDGGASSVSAQALGLWDRSAINYRCFEFYPSAARPYYGEEFFFCVLEDTASSNERDVSLSLFPAVWDPIDTRASVSIVRSRLTECESTHTQCRRVATSELPTRLIDVEALGTGGCVKIVEPKGGTGRYLTLSYCWGTSHTYRTTTSNLGAHLTSIDLDDLPKTLRDAIEYTRLLGFRFLWIDALCIVQDDPDDWKREAGRMCSVYEGATLSLSILDSHDCDGGFLRSKPLLEHLDIDGKRTTIGIERSVLEYHDGYYSVLSQSHLEKRAWALQERILAPAVLHIAADTVLWECCTNSASLDRPESGLTSGAITVLRSVLRSLNNLEALDVWYRTVEIYSTRELTQASDRSAAIRGLATRFQRCRSDTYVAGLWSSDLHYGLLWLMHGDDRERAGRPDMHPSWSWLSVDRPVSFPYSEHATSSAFTAKCTLECANTPHEDQSGTPFLRISGSYERGRLGGKPSDALCGPEVRLFLHDSRSSTWADIMCHLDRPGGTTVSASASAADDQKRGPSSHDYPIYLLLVTQDARNTPKPATSACELLFYYLILERLDMDRVKDRSRVPISTDDLAKYAPFFRRIGTGLKRVFERNDHALVDRAAHQEIDGSEEWVRDMYTRQVFKQLTLV